MCHDNEESWKKLKKNWLVSLKLTRGIWQILIWALKNLKNFHFNSLLLTKVNNVWAKESIEELFLIALDINAKFEGKITCSLKNDKKFSKFSPEHLWKSKNCDIMGTFYPK